MRSKVAVIGAGTAGLIAARELASQGIDTRVYERKKRPGYPPNASGIVSIAGLKGLGIGYRGAVTNTLYGANIHVGKEVMRVISEKPVANVLDRERLNLACREESARKGAKLFTNRNVDSKELDSLHRDSIIVGADGAVSSVARHFSMGAIGDHVLTYKGEFDAMPRDARVVDLFFGSEVAPKFFGWMCPNSKDTLEVGIGIGPGHGNSKAAFDRLMKVGEVSEAVGGSRMLSGYASIIPLRTRERIVDEREDVLLVGDAAGQVKPTTGGGIVFGGNGAILAARAISDHINTGSGLEEYEKAFNGKFGSDLAMHRALGRIYSGMGTGNLALLVRAAKALGAESFLSKYGDMDRPSVMLRRFFLRGLTD
jgi:digeranylgeranylglycerophospholipid reductase